PCMAFSVPRSSVGRPSAGSRPSVRARRLSSRVGMASSILRGMAAANTLDLHQALADDTRYRLYRYIGLAGRPVSVREMSRRLSLHPNTLRAHPRRLEEAELAAREARRPRAAGRPTRR